MVNTLAQVLYILFSYIEHHQIKQITQIKIKKCTINTQTSKLKCDYVITDAIYKERLKY